MPSDLEVKNAKKVLSLLEQIDGITYEQSREDIFQIVETETGNGYSLTVDVEETIVSLIMAICEIPADDMAAHELAAMLLEANGTSVHGFFCIVNGNVVLKDNLEFENLDGNELEAALVHMFLTAAQNMGKIVETLAGEPVEA